MFVRATSSWRKFIFVTSEWLHVEFGNYWENGNYVTMLLFLLHDAIPTSICELLSSHGWDDTLRIEILDIQGIGGTVLLQLCYVWFRLWCPDQWLWWNIPGMIVGCHSPFRGISHHYYCWLIAKNCVGSFLVFFVFLSTKLQVWICWIKNLSITWARGTLKQNVHQIFPAFPLLNRALMVSRNAIRTAIHKALVIIVRGGFTTQVIESGCNL